MLILLNQHSPSPLYHLLYQFFYHSQSMATCAKTCYFYHINKTNRHFLLISLSAPTSAPCLSSLLQNAVTIVYIHSLQLSSPPTFSYTHFHQTLAPISQLATLIKMPVACICSTHYCPHFFLLVLSVLSSTFDSLSCHSS